MAVQIPNGSQVAIASGYATAVNVTAITNANPGVATATNTYSAGDFVEVTCGWSRLNNRIVRVSAPTATTFGLEGIDTTNTIFYSPGAGAGSVRKISGWTQVTQIMSISADGGEQQFDNNQFLESDYEIRVPTIKSATGMTLVIADDPSLPGYQLLSTANDDRVPRAVRVLLPNGSALLYNGYVSLNKTPDMTVNKIMTVQATLSLIAQSVRYTS